VWDEGAGSAEHEEYEGGWVMKYNEYSFKDLLSAIVDNRGKTCPIVESGIPLIATNCIKNDHLYPTYDKIRYVSQETYEIWFRGHPEPGDMIFVCKGSPGRVSWVPDPIEFCIAQDMLAIRADETKVYPEYLFALLRSEATQKQIENMHVGTLIPHFKKSDFGKLLLQIPDDYEYQKMVGDNYFKFCEKIELNRQINQTLESMAQAIFKSWFVDFAPVKAKIAALESGEDAEGVTRAAMRAISGKTDDELDKMEGGQPENYARLKTTAGLFPSAMQETELGEVPEGWKAGTVKDVVTRLTPTKRYTKRQVMPYGRVPVLEQGADIILGYHDDEAGFTASPDKSIFIFGDHTCITYLSCQHFDISQNVIPLEGNKLPTMWVYYAVKDLQSFQEYRRHWSEFSIKPVIVPDKLLSDVFSELATSFYTNKENNINQSAKLSQLRDTLLPKLLSGELSVDAIEIARGE